MLALNREGERWSVEGFVRAVENRYQGRQSKDAHCRGRQAKEANADEGGSWRTMEGGMGAGAVKKKAWRGAVEGRR